MSSKEEISSCYHCGADCDSDKVQFEEKDFCCSGCKTVYEILKDNDLCNYYDIENSPGISLKAQKQERFAYLDQDEIQTKLIEFKEGDTAKVSFYIPQIHCYSCLWLLEKLFVFDKGIKSSKVNYLKKEVTIQFNQLEISLRSLVELLSKIGYAPLIRLADSEKDDLPSFDKRVYVQLGVAGFCFGNVMLLSFPEYLSNDGGFALENFSSFFGYISLVFGLIVLTVSGKDYLRSAFFALKNKTINMDVPISLGIISIFSVSVYEVISKSGSGYIDSLAGLLFFLLIGKLFQQKTFFHLSFERNYKSYFPLAVTKIINNEELSIAFEKIEIGDRLLLRNQELIPADSVLISEKTSIDYSFVTGESKPVIKNSGDKLFAGGKVKGEAVEIEVLKKPSQSYLTKLWNEQNILTEQKEDLTQINDRIGKYFTVVVIAVALGAFFYWVGDSLEIALKSFVSVLIVACPCALALAVPFALGNAMRVLSRHKMYVKSTRVLERIGGVKEILFDKTGTITDSEKTKINYSGVDLTAEDKRAIKSIVRNSSHPLSRKLERFLSDFSNELVLGFKEIEGKGVEAEVGGCLYRVGSASFVGGEKIDQTAVYITKNGGFLGCFIFSNSYRDGFSELVASLKSNFRLGVLSGDSDSEKERLKSIMGEECSFQFNQSPFDKLEVVKQSQKNGMHVMMVGDGLNDSGALLESSVGVAITEDVNNFTPASDVIFMGDKLTQLNKYFSYVKSSLFTVYLCFGLSFLYNIIGLSFAVTGVLSPLIAAVLMPISSVTVVVVALSLTSLFESRLK